MFKMGLFCLGHISSRSTECVHVFRTGIADTHLCCFAILKAEVRRTNTFLQSVSRCSQTNAGHAQVPSNPTQSVRYNTNHILPQNRVKNPTPLSSLMPPLQAGDHPTRHITHSNNKLINPPTALPDSHQYNHNTSSSFCTRFLSRCVLTGFEHLLLYLLAVNK